MRLKISAATATGQIRPMNEDRFLVATESGFQISDRDALVNVDTDGDVILAVADGMGGAEAGRFASWCALNSFYRSFQGMERFKALAVRLHQSLVQANDAILIASSANPQIRGCGASIAVFVRQEEACCIARIGNADVRLIRDTEVVEILRQLDAFHFMWCGHPPTLYPLIPPEDVFPLISCLGANPKVKVSIANYAPADGDVVFLGTDGVSYKLAHNEFAERLASTDISRAASEFVDLADSRGGEDNMSAIFCAINQTQAGTDTNNRTVLDDVQTVQTQYSGSDEVGKYVVEVVRWHLHRGKVGRARALAEAFPEDKHRDYLLALIT